MCTRTNRRQFLCRSSSLHVTSGLGSTQVPKPMLKGRVT